jgi:hypothetical protein
LLSFVIPQISPNLNKSQVTGNIFTANCKNNRIGEFRLFHKSHTAFALSNFIKSSFLIKILTDAGGVIITAFPGIYHDLQHPPSTPIREDSCD